MKGQSGIQRITAVMLRAATAKKLFPNVKKKQLLNGRNHVLHSKIYLQLTVCNFTKLHSVKYMFLGTLRNFPEQLLLRTPLDGCFRYFDLNKVLDN